MLEEYRSGLRAWIGVHLAARPSRELDTGGQRAVANGLYDAGFLHADWPAELGGRGLPTEAVAVFNEEMRDYLEFLPYLTVTVGICARTLADCASVGIVQRHVPRMLRGDEVWTQLLSEPGAGSDLSSISTRAVFADGRYVVNGQKVWTSSADQSDFALALVRTSAVGQGSGHAGISMLIVDLHSPGVSVRPIRQMTGESSFFEVFLDDVLVPAEALVGKEGWGWHVLSRMLFHERVALTAETSGPRMDPEVFGELLALARSRGVADVPQVRQALVEVLVREALGRSLAERLRSAVAAAPDVGPIGSLGKMHTASTARFAAETAMLIGGDASCAWPGDDEMAERISYMFLHFPMTGIAGGTSEIQRNIVAERLLGLPREPRGPARGLVGSRASDSQFIA
jgi:alkylation response protein AidB-like acyl-CoA dehydrogenase